MAATPSIDVSGWLHEQLAELLRWPIAAGWRLVR
jgi:hypothetical protein